LVYWVKLQIHTGSDARKFVVQVNNTLPFFFNNLIARLENSYNDLQCMAGTLIKSVLLKDPDVYSGPGV